MVVVVCVGSGGERGGGEREEGGRGGRVGEGGGGEERVVVVVVETLQLWNLHGQDHGDRPPHHDRNVNDLDELQLRKTSSFPQSEHGRQFLNEMQLSEHECLLHEGT